MTYVQDMRRRHLQRTIREQERHPHVEGVVQVIGSKKNAWRVAHLVCIACCGVMASYSLRWDAAHKGWDATLTYHFQEGCS